MKKLSCTLFATLFTLVGCTNAPTDDSTSATAAITPTEENNLFTDSNWTQASGLVVWQGGPVSQETPFSELTPARPYVYADMAAVLYPLNCERQLTQLSLALGATDGSAPAMKPTAKESRLGFGIVYIEINGKDGGAIVDRSLWTGSAPANSACSYFVYVHEGRMPIGTSPPR